jgi:hypothetical protein
MTVAAIIGWLLSRLPASKQKIYIGSPDRLKSEKRRGGGGLLRPLWNGGGNYKATSCRLFDKEDCGKDEVSGREFNRRCYQMGGLHF